MMVPLLQSAFTSVTVLASRANTASTLVGVLEGGHTLATEIIAAARKLPTHTTAATRATQSGSGEHIDPTDLSATATRPVRYRFSILGHSLGGLFARCGRCRARRPSCLVVTHAWCCVGGLRACLAELAAHPTTAHGRLLHWVSYTSLCSPHLGSIRPGGTAAKVWQSVCARCLSSRTH